MSQDLPQSFRYQLRWFHPGILDVNQPRRQFHWRLDKPRELNLAHFATREFERQLLHLGPRQVGKEGLVAAPAYGPAPIVAKTHVHADFRAYAVNGACNEVQKPLRV